MDSDETQWVVNHGLCISIALRVAAEAKLETGDDRIIVLNHDHRS